MNNIKHSHIYISILILFLLFSFGIGNYHLFDWDEINFAESSREMIRTGIYSRVQVNFMPFWEKPPLFFWIQSTFMQLFGVNEWSARIINTIVGLFTCWCAFIIGKQYFNARFGTIWAFVFSFSLLPFFYIKSGIIDPLFNIFIFLSVFQIYNLYERSAIKHALFSGAFLGLAVLTKGPVAVLIVLITSILFWISTRRWGSFKIKHLFIIAITCTVVSALWFGLEMYKNGFWFIEEFITYQIRLFKTPDAGHGQPWFYHPLVVSIGCFPMAIWGIAGLLSREKTTYMRLNALLFWVVMVLFSLVTTKIVHYSSMCYLPLSFLAATQIYKLSETGKLNRKHLLFIFNCCIGLLLAMGFSALPVIDQVVKSKALKINDPFIKSQNLASINWGFLDYMNGLPLIICLIVSIFLYFNNKFLYSYILQAFGLIISLNLATISTVNKVETYSQKSYITMLKSIRHKTGYKDVMGFKSYAHLFYTAKSGLDSNEAFYTKKGTEENYFLSDTCSQPVYFITRNKDADYYLAIPKVKRVIELNGYMLMYKPRSITTYKQ